MRLTAITSIILLTFCDVTYAQIVDCARVLDNVQNISTKTSLRERFIERKTAICQDKFSQFSSAQQSKQSIGVDIPSYFSGTFNEKTTASNYRGQYDRFCGFDFLNYVDIADSFEQIAMIDRNAIQAWQACAIAQSRGFAIALTPGSNNDSFIVSINHRNFNNPTFSINGWNFKPDARADGADCDVVGYANPTFPLEIKQATATLNCQKPADATLQYAVSTDQGEFSIELIGTDDELRKLRSEVLSLKRSSERNSATIEKFQGEVKKLRSDSKNFIRFGGEAELYSPDAKGGKHCLRGIGGGRAEKSAYMLECDRRWYWKFNKRR